MLFSTIHRLQYLRTTFSRLISKSLVMIKAGLIFSMPGDGNLADWLERFGLSIPVAWQGDLLIVNLQGSFF